MLQDSWGDITATLELMKRAGWPTNVDLIADIWGAAAVMLGRPKETYELAKEAAATRPSLDGVQRNLELLAMNIDDLKTALLANSRQPTSATQVFRRIGILHRANSHTECVATLEDNLASLPQDHELYPISLVMAALSADRLLRTGQADTFAAILLTKPDWEAHYATLKFFRAIGTSVLKRDAALHELLSDYCRLGQPLVVALQLFNALDANDKEQAKSCIEVAEHIVEFQQLGLDGEFHLAQACATLNDWSEVLAIADRAISKHEHVDRFYAVRALALDKLGRSPDALTELRRLINAGMRDRLATDTYVNIAMRSGFSDEALQLAEKLLEEETNTDRRLECLHLLFNLLQAREPGSRRAVDVAWAMGMLVDQNEERPEGQFLALIFTVSSSSDAQLSDERVIEFKERLSRFFEKWPESTILRRGFLPEASSEAEFLDALKNILGEPETPSPEMLKLERQVGRGEIPVPFLWRPQVLLRGVADVGQLWELAKRSKLDAHQHHLTMTVGDWKERPFRERKPGIPLLDVTALFVILDLGLFDTLFAIFPTVAISQALLVEIRERASPLSHSWAQQRYESLMRELNARFECIEQPIGQMNVSGNRSKAQELTEDFVSLLQNDRYVAYSDDVAFRLYVANGDSGSTGFCTLDILLWAEELKFLTLGQASEMVGLLCSWKVAMAIPNRYFLGAIPAAVASAATLGAAVDLIRSSLACTAVFEGVWNVRKGYKEIATHVGSLLITLVPDQRNNILTIATIVGVWYLKAKLRTDIKMLAGVQRLATLIAQAATYGGVANTDTVKRLWWVYQRVVELEYGDSMDEAREREAIEAMGHICARLDLISDVTRTQRPHRAAMSRGLEAGTGDMERFDFAYTRHIAEQGRNAAS